MTVLNNFAIFNLTIEHARMSDSCVNLARSLNLSGCGYGMQTIWGSCQKTFVYSTYYPQQNHQFTHLVVNDNPYVNYRISVGLCSA